MFMYGKVAFTVLFFF
jgi:hypothetical protein